jgi:hypothetical protein
MTPKQKNIIKLFRKKDAEFMKQGLDNHYYHALCVVTTEEDCIEKDVLDAFDAEKLQQKKLSDSLNWGKYEKHRKTS